MSALSELLTNVQALAAAVQDKPVLLVFLMAIASLGVVAFALKVVLTVIAKK